VRLDKRIFNNRNRRSLRHYPTMTKAKNLDDAEAKIFDMVARRFVAAFIAGGIRRHDTPQQVATQKLRPKAKS